MSFLTLYQLMMDYAGAGVTVPLIGFRHLLFDGVKEAVDAQGVLGRFTGGLKAAAGLSTALIFDYLAGLIFKPRMKK